MPQFCLSWGIYSLLEEYKDAVLLCCERDEDMEQLRHLCLQYGVDRLPCYLDVDNDRRIYNGSLLSEDGNGSSAEDRVCELFQQGLTLHEACDWVHAAAAFAAALELDPAHAKASFNLASICHLLDLPTLAVHACAQVLLRTPQDMTTHAFLWALAQNAQASPALLPCCIRAYKSLAAGGDLHGAHKLAALTGTGSTSRRGDPNYARQIYDDMGSVFEGKLVDHLGYRGPWQLHEMVCEVLSAGHGWTNAEDVTPKGSWRILDLGCGSGLCGKVFSDFSSQNMNPLVVASSCAKTVADDSSELVRAARQPGAMIAGADVSSKMVDISRSSGFYHSLACCDLLAALAAMAEAELDLVIAADTFIYVGALGNTFASVGKVLRPGGFFAFSIEDLDKSPMKMSPASVTDSCTAGDDKIDNGSDCKTDEEGDISGAVPGWGAALLSSARFAHSVVYIERLAHLHGLRVLLRREVVLRCESLTPLTGQLFVLVLETERK